MIYPSNDNNIVLHPRPLQCLGGGLYLWSLSPRMALACAGVSALLWTVALFYGQFTRRAQRIYQDALAESNTTAGLSVS